LETIRSEAYQSGHLCAHARLLDPCRSCQTLGMPEKPAVIDTSGTDDDVAQWVWNNLVPKNGQASSLQGELLRATEKLRWKAQENGNINWDESFLMFVDLLRDNLLAQSFFSDDEKQSIAADLNRLSDFVAPDELSDDEVDGGQLPYTEDDLYDRLVTHVVKFCRQLPQVIPRQAAPAQYR
jgi:hypothetical protein